MYFTSFSVSRTLHYLGATIYGLGSRDTISLKSEEYKHIAKYFRKADLAEMLQNVDYFINILPNTNATNNILGDGILQNCKGSLNRSVVINEIATKLF